MNIRGRVNYKEVLKGDIGFTYTPHITQEGVLYWTNNGNLPNPYPVNLHGEQGFYFTPHVDNEGNLSWSNNGNLDNPTTVNIKGEQGFYFTPHVSSDGILTWTNNGGLPNPNPFNISHLIINEVKEARTDLDGHTFTKLNERLNSDYRKLIDMVNNSNITIEVDQARTATTGETFDTLDERLDHEFDRLNKKIEITMLQQMDKESHTVENTVEGLTTDMVIKGRTLQNLVSNTPAKNAGNVQIEKLLKSEMFKVGTTYTVNIPNRNNKPIIVVVKTPTGDTKNINLRGVENNFTVEAEYPIVYRLTLHSTNGWDVNNDLTNADNIVVVEGNNIIVDKYFEGIKSFGQQEDKISILSHGKNFFSKYDTAIFVPKGEYVVSSSVTEGAKRLRIKCEKDDLSNFSGMYYDASGNYQTRQDSTQINNLTFTVTRDCYLTFKYLDDLEKPYNNIQLEKGTNSTHFEPYKEDKKDILLPFQNGLKSIENICDELDSNTNKVTERIGIKVYNGSESGWGILNDDKLISTIQFYLETSDYMQKYSNLICDKLLFVKERINTDGVEGISKIGDNDRSIWVTIQRDKLTTKDVNGFKNWLKDNPLTVYYELKKPVETTLDKNINLKVFNEKTYVNFENSINGTSSFKIPVDTNKVINKLLSDKDELNDKYNNMVKDLNKMKNLMISILPYKEV